MKTHASLIFSSSNQLVGFYGSDLKFRGVKQTCENAQKRCEIAQKRCEIAQKRCEIVDKEKFSYDNPRKPYIFY